MKCQIRVLHTCVTHMSQKNFENEKKNYNALDSTALVCYK